MLSVKLIMRVWWHYYIDIPATDLHTVTAWPSLTPVLQKSPTFSPTQVRAMKSREPAPLSPRLASASSEMWFEIHLRRHKLALTDQVRFVLLQDETVASVRGTEGGRGRVTSAVRALCSAALTAVQAPAWDRERCEVSMRVSSLTWANVQ